MSVYERLQEERRDAKKTKWAQTGKASSQDWWTHRKTRGQRISDYYRKKSGERVYERTYLDDDT